MPPFTSRFAPIAQATQLKIRIRACKSRIPLRGAQPDLCLAYLSAQAPKQERPSHNWPVLNLNALVEPERRKRSRRSGSVRTHETRESRGEQRRDDPSGENMHP